MCNPIFGRFLRFFLLNDAPKMYLIQPLTPLLFFHLLHRYIAHIKSYFSQFVIMHNTEIRAIYYFLKNISILSCSFPMSLHTIISNAINIAQYKRCFSHFISLFILTRTFVFVYFAIFDFFNRIGTAADLF